MRYQVAAYRNAQQDSIIKRFGTEKFWEHGEYIEGCGVLRLDKETGLPEWKDTSKTYEQDLKVFNSMVQLYYDRHPIILKRVKGE